MIGDRIRRLREDRGLTQTELATRAGVSRQTVGALESGRHLPRVDAALALAQTLGIDVGTMFAPMEAPVDVISGETPRDGSLVRVGLVGDRMVSGPVRVGGGGWDVADAQVVDRELELLTRMAPGVVLAGCEPGLEVLERILRERGRGALSASCSSANAITALIEGRVHAAVVHGRRGVLPHPPPSVVVDRLHLCRWRVGLAGPPGATRAFFGETLSGGVPVVQREPGAGVQLAYERAVGAAGAPGPVVGGHLDAARLAIAGMPAVTIEPAALAVGAEFHPLETHEAEIWISSDWVDDPVVEIAITEIDGPRFQSRLLGVGGYDLEGIGRRQAPDSAEISPR